MLWYPNCTPIGLILLFQGPQEINHGCTSRLHLLMNFRNNAGSLALVLMLFPILGADAYLQLLHGCFQSHSLLQSSSVLWIQVFQSAFFYSGWDFHGFLGCHRHATDLECPRCKKSAGDGCNQNFTLEILLIFIIKTDFSDYSKSWKEGRQCSDCSVTTDNWWRFMNMYDWKFWRQSFPFGQASASTSWKPSWAQMGWIPIMGSHISFMFRGYFTHVFRAQGIKKPTIFFIVLDTKKGANFPDISPTPNCINCQPVVIHMSPHLYPRAAKQLRLLPWADIIGSEAKMACEFFLVFSCKDIIMGI